MKKLVPLLLFLVSMPTMAQRQFDIEVIIFKRAVDAEKTSESWPMTQTEIDLTKTGSFADSEFRGSKGVSMLGMDDYHLSDQVTSLKKHAGFDVLVHKAWRQGDEGKIAAPVFHIQAGRDYSELFNSDGSEKIEFTDATPVEGVIEESFDQPLYELDGKLQVYVQHYLYAETQLDLKSPSIRKVILEDKQLDNDFTVEQLELEMSANESTVDESLPGETLPEAEAVNSDTTVLAGHMKDVTPTVEVEEYLKNYRMDQKRRMRSTETHYLDHPLLGIIIQVRRVEQS
ncbi:peptidoglycan binding protein CsiV [Vibrio sp. ZSDE26]|uniref:Peptidoglycan binding protein CsiV n=1 Tax=Vibrio amylolyticus TaxID=2847292 RepID=A0A9X2BGE3_9VIBR|nr:peptidoglycan binding protein CsiV [Vibrio amylolyticus]MCK6262806.1 peptidoglycan binding protein CsiV [Vibrio amylolyticus]